MVPRYGAPKALADIADPLCGRDLRPADKAGLVSLSAYLGGGDPYGGRVDTDEDVEAPDGENGLGEDIATEERPRGDIRGEGRREGRRMWRRGVGWERSSKVSPL